MKELYVVNCCRTAIGSFGGALKNTPAVDLGAIVIKEALNRAGVKPEQVDEVMFGCILTAGLGQNPARQAALKAGVPISVPAYTVGMVCGSGMKSVIEGARAILTGDANIVVAGGTENMSAAPYALPDERWGARMGDKKVVDTMIRDGLWDAYNNYHMGTTAENICDVWGITRQELDEFAAASQQKAEAARAQREKATQEADVIVKTEIDKRRRELEAEAEAEQIRRRAKGEADAILAKMQAEAQGAQEILVKQADGLRQIVAAAGGDADHAVCLMLADKMEELMRIQVDAVKGIKIDKVTVWDGGEQKDGKTATAGFVSGLMKSIPPMNEMFDMAGMELPRFLGKNKEEPAAPPAPAEESGAPAEES